jgi:putative SOS response-associated peptidase YedK
VRPHDLAWNSWTDKTSGEAFESYTMLTLNGDCHPLMNRMHKPDPKLGPGQQDKRSVVPIELDDVDAWLNGSQEAAAALVRLAPAEVFDAVPVAR